MGNSFRENLRDELDFQDMTVKMLSAKTGIPKPTLDCYLSNRNTIPPADIAVKIALALNVTVEQLVLGSNNLNKSDESGNYKRLITNLSKLPLSFQNMLETMVCATAENKSITTIIKNQN